MFMCGIGDRASSGEHIEELVSMPTDDLASCCLLSPTIQPLPVRSRSSVEPRALNVKLTVSAAVIGAVNR